MNKHKSAQRARWSLWCAGVLAASLLAGCGGGSGEGAGERATATTGVEGRARPLALAPPANSGGMNRLTDGTRALRLVSAPNQYVSASGTGLAAPLSMVTVAAGATLPPGTEFQLSTFLFGLGSNCADFGQRTSVDEVWPPAAGWPHSFALLRQQARGLRHVSGGFVSGVSGLNVPLSMGPVTTGWAAGYCATPDGSGRGFRLSSPFSPGYLTLKDGQLMLREDDRTAAFAASAVWEAVDLSSPRPCCTAPSVKIRETLPAVRATAGEPVGVRVDAEPGSSGQIGQLELFNGFVRLKANDAFDGVVKRLPVGQYRLIARATSGPTFFGTSPAVDFQVVPPAAPRGYVPPSATLSAPGLAAGPVSLTVGSAVSLVATPSGNSGTVQAVEFLNGATVVSHAKQLPARWAWAPGVGSYNISVRVTDHYGNRTTSAALAVKVAALPAGSAPLPAVQLSVSPASGTAPEGITQRLTASIGAPLPADSHVEFYDGVDLIGGRTQAPFSVPWAGRVGPHMLTAVVVDGAGRRSTSVPVTFAVTPGAPPPVDRTYPYFFSGGALLEQPANGSTGSAGQPLFVTIKPIGGDEFAHPRDRLELYVADLSRLDANSQVPLEFVDSAPAVSQVSSTLVWRKPRAGRFALVPRVVAAHARGVSESRGVVFREGSTVDVRLVPSALTQVTIGAPAPAQSQLFSPPPDTVVQLGQGLILKARASGSDGTSATAASVRFLVNGQVIDSQGPASSHSTPWLPTAAGSFTVTSIVTDSVTGAQITSAPVTLHAVAPGGVPAINRPFNWAPGVSLTSPANAARVAAGSAVTVRALAEDIGGRVMQVVLRSNTGDVELPGVSGSLSQYGKAAYERTWTASTVAGPTATFWAEATDDLGATTITPKVSITVLPSTANRPPSVSLTSAPALPGVLTVGTRFVLRATAADADGRVVKVEYFNNGRPMGTATQAPWRVDGVATWVGPHRITARATDDQGATTTTADQLMWVRDPRAPTVRVLGTPALPGTLTVGTPFALRADTSNAAVQIVKVEYFDNGRFLGVVDQAPWRLDGVASWVGPHRISARATDAQGNASTSPEVILWVRDPHAPTVRVLGAPALPGTLTVGTPFALRADTSNAAAQIVKVEYFDNGRFLGVVNQAPWRLDGVASWVGPHRITARATDAQGNASASPEVLMQVVAAK